MDRVCATLLAGVGPFGRSIRALGFASSMVYRGAWRSSAVGASRPRGPAGLSSACSAPVNSACYSTAADGRHEHLQGAAYIASTWCSTGTKRNVIKLTTPR
jgi:hypothetical protein